MMDWIKVEHRLPKSGERILIYWTHRGKQVPDIIDYESDAFELLQSVTHWRPLPPPPGSDEPAPAGDERRALGDELIAFCADPDNVEYYDDNGDPFCAFCGDVQANGVEHLPDCLHLRAGKLQERDDE